jgi:hypothetical protein
MYWVLIIIVLLLIYFYYPIENFGSCDSCVKSIEATRFYNPFILPYSAAPCIEDVEYKVDAPTTPNETDHVPETD